MKEEKKKEKTYICKICKNKKKSSKKEICCSEEMTAESKGTWNA